MSLPLPNNPAFKLVKKPSNIKRTDRVVWTLSITGAGKTSFIREAMNVPSPPGKTGFQLKSQTKLLQAVRLTTQGNDIVVVDTPGLDHSDLSDAQLIQVMSEWLEYTHKLGILEQKLLYFHRITDNRTMSRVLTLLKKLIGTEFGQHTIFVTTMGGGSRDSQVEIDQLNILRNELSMHDARTRRFDQTYDSAWKILREVVTHTGKHSSLLLQKELAEGKLHLSQTQCGRFLLDILSTSTLPSEMQLALTVADEESENYPLLATIQKKAYQKKKQQLIRHWEQMARISIEWRLNVWVRRKYARMVHGTYIL